ncbi:MAG: hypothetical protein AAFQ14_04015 [Cyanobacteria bacterium J06621_12]
MLSNLAATFSGAIAFTGNLADRNIPINIPRTQPFNLMIFHIYIITANLDMDFATPH